MNKIDSAIEHISSVSKAAQSGNKPSAVTGGNFQQALSQAFDIREGSPMNSTAPLEALEEIAPMHMPVIQEPSQVVNGKTNDLLDLLDHYAGQLQDTNISLKALSPVLEKINHSADGLLSAARTLGDEDTQLQQIANQTALTARNAYIQFQRGDLL